MTLGQLRSLWIFAMLASQCPWFTQHALFHGLPSNTVAQSELFFFLLYNSLTDLNVLHPKTIVKSF